MCGIFGIISSGNILKENVKFLAEHAQQRGQDSSGLMTYQANTYHVHRADYSISKLLKNITNIGTHMIMGHSRLVTNGLQDNQPILRDGICVIHNGIIVNHEEIWAKIGKKREQVIDTEVLAAIASKLLEDGHAIEALPELLLQYCKGIVACAMAIPHLGKLLLFSNNGSLYTGKKEGVSYFASEAYALTQLDCKDINQHKEAAIFDIPISENIEVVEKASRTQNLIPELIWNAREEELLESPKPSFLRCTKCILPETMPFIRFDNEGVCNYCNHYVTRNKPKPKEKLFDLVKPYRRSQGNDCIVPFSGGRDSCYALHLIVNELKMKPVTYTYDWGMVTDLGRRNISRMSAELGVENIIVADNITKKRENIKKNLVAWLKSPHLGMISILTAGDKHFFRHVETIKEQTGIQLNLWGVNPLEVTHFKSGFLGVPPDFEEDRVYISSTSKQLRYQQLRFKAMLQSPGYFNSSLWDTVTGEYHRSFAKRSDYFHIFDFWTWDEHLVDQCLAQYDWELAPDTSTTWRIGDGTAAFYNYIYYIVAGFTEHDTFRSNQIREGVMTREEALVLVEDENRPRYPNIKWYLDALGLDFSDTIKIINSIPRLYSNQ